MDRVGLIGKLTAFFLVGFLVLTSVALAKPTTPEQARNAVENWLALETQPLGTDMFRWVKEVTAYPDADGQTAYFVVSLHPAGLVIVAADDLVEPIIGFMPFGHFDPSPASILGALVSRDLPGRLAQAREIETRSVATDRQAAAAKSQRKWSYLTSSGERSQKAMGLEATPNVSDLVSGIIGPPSDELVAPLVQSHWGQEDQVGAPLYNYFTPNHYPCGCTATVMAQIMRKHNHPVLGIGKILKSFYINGSSATGYTRGGDGNGGPYNWTEMVYVPGAGLTDPQRQAIGALTYDAGISVDSDYTEGGTSGGANYVSNALMEVFKYANAVRYATWLGQNIPGPDLYNMINTNLDAGYPVDLTILGGTGVHANHAVVCDGYGYNLGTMYHHINIGEEGMGDIWYTLPYIDSGSNTWNVINQMTYNIFPSGTGEIISGRVTDTCGAPLLGAKVTATRSDGYDIIGTSTNAKGIYVFTGMPSNTTWSIAAAMTGYSFQTQTVEIGISKNHTEYTGNRWGLNFRSGLNVSWTPKYRLFNLATTGTSSCAYKINASGAVVGAMKSTSSSPSHATLWLISDSGGKPVRAFDLNTLKVGDKWGNNSIAYDISDNGLVVGRAQKPDDTKNYPCYWDSSTLPVASQLATFNDNEGAALGVNNLGKIVGNSWFYPPDAMLWAVFWPNTASMVQGLSSGTGSPCAHRINDQGVAVGVINNRASRWYEGAQSYLDPTGSVSEAFSVPNLPVTMSAPVGNYTNAAGRKVACIFSGTETPTELGSLGGNSSTAYGVNKSNQVVGQATNAAGRGRAFIWDPVNGMRDLNSLIDEPDWVLNTAYDINDKGEIVGWGWYKCVYDFAFILKPIEPPKKGFLSGVGFLLLGD
jgi:probable HAF family extracellular repeat protein